MGADRKIRFLIPITPLGHPSESPSCPASLARSCLPRSGHPAVVAGLPGRRPRDPTYLGFHLMPRRWLTWLSLTDGCFFDQIMYHYLERYGNHMAHYAVLTPKPNAQVGECFGERP